MTGMHEVALMDGILDEVSARVGERRVALVHLEIGELAGVSSDALRFCFELCATTPPFVDAKLEIETIGGAARCNICGVELAMPMLGTPCSCGSFDRSITRGRELRLAFVEVI